MTSLASTSLSQISIMFVLILVGILCYKIRLIDTDTNKKLSDIVLMLVNPIVIFISYQRKFDATLLKGLLISLVLAVITHLFGIIVSILFVRGKKSIDNLSIERFVVVYSNCGFIGIPLVDGIFGKEGVFYITAYMTIFNLFAWTHGIISITGKKDIKSLIKALMSPSVIATVTGFLLFIAQIKLPSILLKSVSYLGDMNTPLAMLVAGVTIAQTDIIKLISKVRIYYISFLRLIFIPVVMLVLFYYFKIPRVVLLTSILAAACPAGATVNLFAIRYGKNYLYASEMFAVSTILSIVTIPLIMMIAGLFV